MPRDRGKIGFVTRDETGTEVIRCNMCPEHLLEIERLKTELKNLQESYYQLEDDYALATRLDHLTKLSHRGHSEEVLAYLLGRMLPGARLCLAILDIDWFKQINDTLGHNRGDTVLKALAAQMRTFSMRFRPLTPAPYLHADRRRGGVNEYLVGRWGGEEFVLAAFNVENPQATFEELGASIKALFPLKDDPDEEVRDTVVTVSIGWTITAENVPVTELIKQADDAMYLAKEFGRNRVEPSVEARKMIERIT